MRNFSLFNHQLLQIYDFGTVLVQPKCGQSQVEFFFFFYGMHGTKRNVVLKEMKPGILGS